MDFGTISNKLNEGKYSTMEEFARDVELVFQNCRIFNPPTTYPVMCADAVERVWKKEWAKAMEKRLSYAEKRSLQGLLKTLINDNMCVFTLPIRSKECVLIISLQLMGLPRASRPNRA